MLPAPRFPTFITSKLGRAELQYIMRQIVEFFMFWNGCDPADCFQQVAVGLKLGWADRCQGISEEPPSMQVTHMD